MKITTANNKVLVIGGRGFIGRHIAKHLEALDAGVIIGTRGRQRELADNQRVIALHKIQNRSEWLKTIEGVDVVVNTVGILRQRFNESYEQVHHHAVACLADACRIRGTRLIHISALGLEANVNSRFMRSKLAGEEALKHSGADWHIVRPSLVDGDGGFGAKWFRRAASWPVHLVPTNAKGRLAPINVDDLGEAVARLALTPEATNEADREFDLGGDEHYTLFEYLEALAPTPPLIKAKIPAFLARLVAHLCDVFHATPYSYGHYELLKYDNLPKRNRLRELLGRPATQVGINRPTPTLPGRTPLENPA